MRRILAVLVGGVLAAGILGCANPVGAGFNRRDGPPRAITVHDPNIQGLRVVYEALIQVNEAPVYRRADVTTKIPGVSLGGHGDILRVECASGTFFRLYSGDYAKDYVTWSEVETGPLNIPRC